VTLSTLPEGKTTASAGRKTVSLRAPNKNGKAFRLGIAVLLTLFLGLGMFRMFGKPAEPAKIMVVAAGRDLAPGCKLGFRDLHMLSVPPSYYSKQMVQSYPELVGSCTNTFIAMGEPILQSQLIPAKQDLQAQLTADQRALTLRLNDDQLVDHEIRTGDHIDILVTATAGSKRYTKTLCQDVKVVLATPKEIQSSDKLRGSENNKITIALAPADVERVSQAAETSKIRLVLRNAQSRMTVALAGADERDLLPAEALKTLMPAVSKLQAPPPPPALAMPMPPPPMPEPPQAESMPAPVQWVVDVFKGATKETHAFEQHE
jgi:Flp pilus assembly protein CpaB